MLFRSSRRPVLDLVLLDEANPRAVAFQVATIVDHLAALAGRRRGDLLDPAERIAQRLAALLETTDADAFDAARIETVESELMALSDAVGTRYFGHAAPAVPAAAAS